MKKMKNLYILPFYALILMFIANVNVNAEDMFEGAIDKEEKKQMEKPKEVAKFKLSVNLNTLTFIGSNAARLSFVNVATESDGSETITIGGSLKETQRGININVSIPIGKNNKYEIPIGADYLFFGAKEMQNYNSMRNITVFDCDMLSFYTGVHRVLYDYRGLFDLTIHGGFTLNFNSFRNSLFEIQFKKNGQLVETIDFDEKDDANRLGISGMIGGEGRLINNVYVNWSFGLTCLNLFWRDDERGELLTPTNSLEDKENLLFGYNIILGILYKF